MEHLKEIYKYREMIKGWTRKELRTRYKGSFLGFLWTFVNPLMQLIIYSLIFPLILKISEENYAMFLFVALIPWNYFTTCLQGSCSLIIANTNLVTKVYFPREVLPLSYTFSGLLNMVFSYFIVFPMLIFFHIQLSWNILWLPVLMLTQTILCAGLSLLMCSVNVYFRDLEYFIGVTLMGLYFLTPIMYRLDTMPESFQRLLRINPMTNFVELYRDITFYGRGLNIQLYFASLIYSVMILLIGYFTFSKLQRKFTEIL